MSNFQIISIPSVLESAPSNLDRVSDSIHKGLKVKIDDKFYIVGDLALYEGVQPHKEINSAPNDLDYSILMSSALLVSHYALGNPLTVTTGFPYATYNFNKNAAMEKLVKDHIIEFDSSIFSAGGVKKLVVEVKKGAILPEVSASAYAIRKLYNQNKDFMMVSLGYGTFETIFSAAEGNFGLQRSASSSQGVFYAIQELKRELVNLYPSIMSSDVFLDEALQNGYFFHNRKKVDISSLRRKVLNNYYDNVVSPSIKRSFTDREYAKTSGLYLSGGGALYPELIERFKEEFRDITEVVIPEEPQYLAAKGYCLNSAKLEGGNFSQAVGIDLGNSSTIICMLKSTE